jgi:hypothetical protein
LQPVGVGDIRVFELSWEVVTDPVPAAAVLVARFKDWICCPAP